MICIYHLFVSHTFPSDVYFFEILYIILITLLTLFLLSWPWDVLS